MLRERQQKSNPARKHWRNGQIPVPKISGLNPRNPGIFGYNEIFKNLVKILRKTKLTDSNDAKTFEVEFCLTYFSLEDI